MTHRTLMVLKMNGEDAEHVAAAFAEHDKSPVPAQIGVKRRVLFRFHDLYLHLIESDEDIIDRLYAARSHPDFKRVHDGVGEFLSHYSTEWGELKDSRAEVFYTWEAPGS